MSASGLVMTLLVKPVPGWFVRDDTMLAATRRSAALVVVTDPLSLVFPLPWLAATTSTGVTELMPLYSAIRISPNGTAVLKVTVTVLVLAAEAAIPAA